MHQSTRLPGLLVALFVCAPLFAADRIAATGGDIESTPGHHLDQSSANDRIGESLQSLKDALQGQPIEGATQIFDNARVTAWDVVWKAALSKSARLNQYDTVSIALTAGAVTVIRADGTSTAAPRAIGDVSFERKGSGHREEAIGSAAPPHTIVVELKDVKVPPLANTSGHPDAFPRPGVKQVLENERVIAWDYTWTPGSPTPMHFHDKDVVVIYLADGVLASTSPDGQVVNNPHSVGFTKFNPRDRTHTETLVKGEGRAIIVELK